ncbi:TadE/TadG family type IV pilus assembly protein [Parasphingorhabdus cellanae]|uniref:TadE/TadG family type IV pilus assembly protein n=1 Tax=Parasphingorhabdus cellanae TaxID=2806553 RepID=UPI001FB1481F|nr:pilus assembly protein [Parasphingorhabdus cellanae]
MTILKNSILKKFSPDNRATRFLKKLHEDKSGLALIEFAFTAPFMLTVGLTGMETANLAVGHLQVSQVAMLVADNASRVRNSIDEADIREIFTGAHLTGSSIDFSPNARIILSNLEHNGETGSDEGQWIRWQRCYGGNTSYTSTYGNEGDGENDSSLSAGIGPVGKKISATPASAVNFVEVVYDYKPLISDRFFGNIVIRYESAFVARERNDHAMKNASNISASERWTCNRYAVIT